MTSEPPGLYKMELKGFQINTSFHWKQKQKLFSSLTGSDEEDMKALYVVLYLDNYPNECYLFAICLCASR